MAQAFQLFGRRCITPLVGHFGRSEILQSLQPPKRLQAALGVIGTARKTRSAHKAAECGSDCDPSTKHPIEAQLRAVEILCPRADTQPVVRLVVLEDSD